MEQHKSFKHKTINDCKHAAQLHKADILRMTLDTLYMNTKQSELSSSVFSPELKGSLALAVP